MKWYLGLVWFAILIGTASAQQEATLHLRNGEEVTGNIIAVTEDSLYLAQPFASHYAERGSEIPVAAYSRFEVLSVETGGGPNIILTTLVGAGIGTFVGSVAALTVNDDSSFLSSIITEGVGFGLIIAGAGVGTLLGFLTGLALDRNSQSFDLTSDENYWKLCSIYGGRCERPTISPPSTDASDH